MDQPWELYVDEDLAKAIGHEVRALILMEANDRVMSPSQFAKRHDLDCSLVSYHFRVLEKYGCLEEIAKVSVRGANQHFFKATRQALFDGKVWEQMPETVRNRWSGKTTTHLLEAVAEAMREETFDERKDRALAWSKDILDEQGWQTIAKIFRDAIYKTMKASEAAKERVETGETEPMLGSWAFLFFKSPFKEPPANENGSGS
ncbi:MAG TPA: winged helix-turn-helix domain-containing protein [Solirubrobacterales bacterium]|nr:winged helix-turn-helix domain-containing protein [Solirubrobacterales bacterium]